MISSFSSLWSAASIPGSLIRDLIPAPTAESEWWGMSVPGTGAEEGSVEATIVAEAEVSAMFDPAGSCPLSLLEAFGVGCLNCLLPSPPPPEPPPPPGPPRTLLEKAPTAKLMMMGSRVAKSCYCGSNNNGRGRGVGVIAIRETLYTLHFKYTHASASPLLAADGMSITWHPSTSTTTTTSASSSPRRARANPPSHMHRCPLCREKFSFFFRSYIAVEKSPPPSPAPPAVTRHLSPLSTSSLFHFSSSFSSEEEEGATLNMYPYDCRGLLLLSPTEKLLL